MPTVLSRWTMPILRASMGLFLALWGLDKLVSRAGAQHIFDRFYHVAIGAGAVQAAGVLEILLGVLLALGLWRRPVAWVALAITAVSTVASWRQILDPWGRLGIGPGGSHLFLASIVLTAVASVLVINAHESAYTLDGRLQRVRAPERTPASVVAPSGSGPAHTGRESERRAGRSVPR